MRLHFFNSAVIVNSKMDYWVAERFIFMRGEIKNVQIFNVTCSAVIRD